MISIKTAIYLGLALLGIFIGIDLYLAFDALKGNTWSEILRTWSKQTSVIPWVYGAIGGHLFHPFIDDPKVFFQQPRGIFILLGITILLAVTEAVGSKFFPLPPPPWAVVMPAFLAGALLWPV
jgi:hypothetical protein